MQAFQKTEPRALPENLFREIGEHWMLVTAKKPDGSFNTMTASWGGTGVLFNKPVAFIFLRPQRYTFGFAEAADTLTLSFFGGRYRDALALCGRKSGRDCNKIAEAGLTPRHDFPDAVFFDEAALVFHCRKLYADFLRPECFLDPSLIGSTYPGGDFHKLFVCEITDVLRAE